MADAGGTYSVRGTVFLGDSGERVEGAIVRAESPQRSTRSVMTDDDGDFSFDSLEAGMWKFTVLHEKGRATSHGHISVLADKEGLRLNLARLMNTEDGRSGQTLFNLLLAGLLTLAVIYILLHLFLRPEGESLSPALGPLLVAAQEEAESAPDVSTSVALTTTVSEIRNSLSDIFTDTIAFSSDERQVLRNANALLTRVQASILANQKAATVAQLRTLKELLEEPLRGGFFWVGEIGRYLEVLFWGLAGVLARLIITVGSYLRWGRYYKEGASLHWAQLVTIPILVLVVVLILSQVTVRLTVSGGTEVNLDLRDPPLLAAVSFLIGIGQWAVWTFIENASSKILGRDNNRRGAGGAGGQEAEN